MIWLLLACAVPTEGVVRGADGTAVAGATLAAGDCQAVTDQEGRFAVHCPPGDRTFVVSHPAFLPSSAATGPAPVEIVLEPIPVGPGVYVATSTRLVELPRLALTRTGDQKVGWSYCAASGGAAPGEAPVGVPAGEVRLLDNHEVDWRLFPISEDGCAYRLEPANGDWWTSPTRAIPVMRESELAPMRSWLTVALEPGRYALIEWYAGGPVPAVALGAEVAEASGESAAWLARELVVREASGAH